MQEVRRPLIEYLHSLKKQLTKLYLSLARVGILKSDRFSKTASEVWSKLSASIYA
jgi:hypothetical protein